MIVRPLTPSPAPTKTAPIQPGANMSMGRNPLGFWFNGPVASVDFSHPFTIQPGAGGIRVSKGLILADISVEPLIRSVPISGDDKQAAPVLKLDPSLVNDSKESWVCVEVTPNADGKLDPAGKASKVEVVQRDFPILTEGVTGRAPLALISFQKVSPQFFQIAMFHLRYVTSQPAQGPRKHFFL